MICLAGRGISRPWSEGLTHILKCFTSCRGSHSQRERVRGRVPESVAARETVVVYNRLSYLSGNSRVNSMSDTVSLLIGIIV